MHLTQSIKQLVNDVDLLENAENYVRECVAADGGKLRITKLDTLLISVTVVGRKSKCD